MTSFLEEVIDDLISQNLQLDTLKFILPNKRAGLFLKKIISKKIEYPIFSPKIVSIEEFIESISGLAYSENTQLLLQFYKVYKNNTPQDEIESFDNVMGWAGLLIQDFNNIDKHLIDPVYIFDYLSQIKDLNHWSKTINATNNIESYLNFWKRLKVYYSNFKQSLLEDNKGYQGLVFRHATTQIDDYCNSQSTHHVLIGFNALNKAEELIFQKLLESNLATIFWDAEKHLIEDSIHDAGLFMRQYKNSWSFYKEHDFPIISNNYISKKNINVKGTPSNISQVKYAACILEQLLIEKDDLESTALVLGDEALLIPLLNSLPKNIGPVNVTMGLKMSLLPITTLFENIFSIQKKGLDSIYYKELIEILTHPLLAQLLRKENELGINKFISTIRENNLSFIPSKQVAEALSNYGKEIKDLFIPWSDSKTALQILKNLIFKLKEFLDIDQSAHELYREFLYRFYKLFNELEHYLELHPYLTSISSLHTIYRQLIKVETLDFIGQPLKGLQVLGMLETRVLDFENVIVLSVNEGILPAGKSDNSFIPYDVKKENKMPTFKEIDAVYTYHFYRLLHRSANVHLIYNSETHVLNGGEMSRFIYQLQFENIHPVEIGTISSFTPPINNGIKTIKKSDLLIERLIDIASIGFSPSSLTNYIRNPLDFYYQKVLDIQEYDSVEESIAANTMGTIMHNVLEHLYRPYLGLVLSGKNIDNMMKEVSKLTSYYFKEEYKGGNISSGKNLIIFNICQQYISKLLKEEKKLIEKGNTIKILGIEEKLKVLIDIPELNFPVYLKGTVDRVDEFNGVKRIIDYKSGRVIQSQVEITDWTDLTSDYKKFSKSFQVLCYAYMINMEEPIEQIEAGIISFKNLKGESFIKFGLKPTSNSRIKDQLITQDSLYNFEKILKSLIIEICNKEIPFVEKPL